VPRSVDPDHHTEPAPIARLRPQLVPHLFRRKIKVGSGIWLFTRDRVAVASLIVVLVVIVLAIFAPLLTPYAQQGAGVPNPGSAFSPPSLRHPLGTDDLGRDEWARLLYGARASLTIGFVVVAIGVIVGSGLGVIAGYIGGWIEEIIMRITDIVLSFPALLLAIALAYALQPSLWSVIIAISATWWPWYTRIVRAQAAGIRERNYVRAARAMGASQSFIVIRHILPNVLVPVRVQATLDLGAAILTGAALSFLGLGAQPPTADWGAMLGTGRLYLLGGDWWGTVFPGAAMFITLLAFNLLGDGFQAIMDPRLR
jgi:peptide/nickel transport system permease protein